jgi:hypothetical protein
MNGLSSRCVSPHEGMVPEKQETQGREPIMMHALDNGSEIEPREMALEELAGVSAGLGEWAAGFMHEAYVKSVLVQAIVNFAACTTPSNAACT